MNNFDLIGMIGELSRGLNNITHQIDALSPGSGRGLNDMRSNIDHFSMDIRRVNYSISEIARSVEHFQKFFDGQGKPH